MQQAQRVLVAPRRFAEISRKNQHESREEAQQGGEGECRAANPWLYLPQELCHGRRAGETAKDRLKQFKAWLLQAVEYA
jgi:hypothetical protein